MNWTLGVVVPVSDVERAKAFYAKKLGFDHDHDAKISQDYHVVQLTAPGSGCSIVVGKGLVDMTLGSLKGLQLVVNEFRAARPLPRRGRLPLPYEVRRARLRRFLAGRGDVACREELRRPAHRTRPPERS
jgi:catechol 2,3-dioxygenase-like lactoylglutathione lyase family enzyme